MLQVSKKYSDLFVWHVMGIVSIPAFDHGHCEVTVHGLEFTASWE